MPQQAPVVKSTPGSSLTPPDYTARDQVLQQLVQRHGVWVGSPTPQIPLDKDTGEPQLVQDPFYTYYWPDGSSVSINGAGQVQALDEKTPQKQTNNGWTNIRNVGNTVYGTDPADGQFKPIPGVPPDAATKGFTNLTPVPQADGTKVYYGIDPADGQFKQVPGAPTVAADTQKPQHPNVTDQTTKQTYVWDDAQSKYVPAPGIPTPQGIPQEGQSRQTIQNGRYVTEVYTGGQWVPKQIGGTAIPGAPQIGQTRQVVENGRNVTQTYDGSNWTTTGVGASAIPGAPQEGDTRQNVQSGYQVQEVYKGGQWIVDPSVAPKRFTPQNQQQVTAPATDPFVATMDPSTGATNYTPNQNYQPKSLADVAGAVSRLQQSAQAYRDQLSGQVASGVITQDKAAQQFDQWWNQNVEPQKAQLAAAQQQAVLDQQKAQQEQARANLATAQSAGDVAVRAAQSQPNIPPGFGDFAAAFQTAVQSGKPMAPMSPQQLQAAVTPNPIDYNDIYQKATAQALQHISPTAAAIMNGPGATPSMLQNPPDVTQQLNMTKYDQFGNPTPAGAPFATAPTPSASPQSNPINVGAMPGANNAQQSTPLPFIPPTPAPVGAAPGQNYGADTAYTGGIPPWLVGQYVPGG